MTIDEVLSDWIADRRREIHVLNSEVTRTRIVFARLESWRRQLDERNVLANSDCLRVRRHRTHEWTGVAFSRERQRRFNFSVLRKVLRVREVEGRARGFQTKLTLLQ